MRTIVPASALLTSNAIGPWLHEVLQAPRDHAFLRKQLEEVENYLILDEDTVIGWIGLMESDEGATLDIAVHPIWHSRWLNRSLIRQAKEIFFKDRKFIKLENSSGKALEWALQMGAQPMYSEDMIVNVYLLTPHNYFKGSKLHG